MGTTIDYAELHDFCLAWMMGYDSMDTLTGWFNDLGWSYKDFEVAAKKMNWFVTSMTQLQDILSNQPKPPIP